MPHLHIPTSSRRPRSLVVAASSYDGQFFRPKRSPHAALVDSVLTDIRGTDGGLNVKPSTRQLIDAKLMQLETLGLSQSPRPLDNPLLYGNYVVSYTSAGQKQYGQPAGGRFRGRLGRTIFQTTGLFQSVFNLSNNDNDDGGSQVVAVNKVAFKLLGWIAGYVCLRGLVKGLSAGSRDTVEVKFAPPRIVLGKVVLEIGPPSSVILTTTYIDQLVRLGRGSRGSLFVFTRGGAADAAGMEEAGLEKPSWVARIAFFSLLAGLLVGGGVALYQALTHSWVVALGLAGLLWFLLGNGGIVNDKDDKVDQEYLQERVKVAGGAV